MQRLQQETAEEDDALEAEIQALEQEERDTVAALEACTKEEQELLAELARQRQQEEQLQREEKDLSLRLAKYQLDLADAEEERAATDSAIRYVKRADLFVQLDNYGAESESPIAHVVVCPVPFRQPSKTLRGLARTEQTETDKCAGRALD
ncbi:unnamed protein product [Effrenium voratum]|nr:unnamed protein product [Effrenium voratum]